MRTSRYHWLSAIVLSCALTLPACVKDYDNEGQAQEQKKDGNKKDDDTKKDDNKKDDDTKSDDDTDTDDHNKEYEECATPCGDNGTCKNGTCKCNEGYLPGANGCEADPCYQKVCGDEQYCYSGECKCNDGLKFNEDKTECIADEHWDDRCAGVKCGANNRCIEGACKCLKDYTLPEDGDPNGDCINYLETDCIVREGYIVPHGEYVPGGKIIHTYSKKDGWVPDLYAPDENECPIRCTEEGYVLDATSDNCVEDTKD